MIQKIKSLLTKASLLTLLVVPFAAPAAAHAADLAGGVGCGSDFSISGVTRDGAGAGCSKPGAESGTSIDNILKLVINIFSIVVGVISVIMIIIGGLKYIMSGGNDANLVGAKNTILYAVIGLVIVALAQIIVKFVLNKVNTAAGV